MEGNEKVMLSFTVYSHGFYFSSIATMDYITDEENILPRAGAITIGGLAGLIIGARKKGGLVKRVLYTSTGVVSKYKVIHRYKFFCNNTGCSCFSL